MLTCSACARQRWYSAGGAAAMTKNESGKSRKDRMPALLCGGSGLGKLLFRHSPARQRFRRGALQQFVRVADRKFMAAVEPVQLFPGNRRGDRRAFARPCRIGHDRSRAALVAQPVEEDPPLALVLADVGGEYLGLRFRDRPTE